MLSNTKNIELNEQFVKSLNFMELNSRNIFITGKAGTGKSTLLTYFRRNTQKKIAVLAPTGTQCINEAMNFSTKTTFAST